MTIQIGGGGGGGSGGGGSASGLGIDVWGSQANPESVTDWGPIINGLATRLSRRRLNFSAHDFPFHTKIDWRAFKSATLQGETGLVWTEYLPEDRAGARLVWTGGAGSGTAISLDNSNGCTIADLAVVYNNPAYDGDLITIGAISAWGQVYRCFVGSDDGVVNSARTLINLHGAVGAIVENCTLTGGQVLIRGFDGAATVSNDIVIRKTEFANAVLSAIRNIGLNWTIDSNTFEFSYGTVAGATNSINMSGIDTDTLNCSSVFTAINNTFWDFTSDTLQTCIKQRVNNTMSASIIGGYCDIQANGTYFDLQGPGMIALRDVQFSANGPNQVCVNLGSSATALKRVVRIAGCNWGLSTNQVQNITGHDQLTIETNGSMIGGGHGPQLRTIYGYERVGNGHTLPTVVVHTGLAAGWSVQSVQGNDMAGMITAYNLTGSAIPVGKVLDVTFATPMLASQRTQGSQTWLSVLVSGMEIAGWTSGAASAACAPYASVFNSTTDASIASTGFSIGIANAIPNGAQVTFAYRVIQL